MAANEYQWKLNIIERNLLMSNWQKLLLEAQETTLKEAEELLEYLPLPDKQKLTSSLEILQLSVEEEMQQKIQNILRTDKRLALNFHVTAQGEKTLPQRKAPIRVFVRQPFTESGNIEKGMIQGVLDLLRSLDEQSLSLEVLTGLTAQSKDTFHKYFQKTTGLEFTPANFRSERLRLLDTSDAMIVVRTGLSESGAFEVAYNIFGGRRVPIFFAVWQQTPIKTTLLRDLDELCYTTYVTFDNPEELRTPLSKFLARIPTSYQLLPNMSVAS